MLVDTHAHINFNAYRDDADDVIRRSLDNDVWMINVGTQYDTSKKAVEIAEKYEKGVYAAIGLHPINLDTGLVKMKIDAQEGSNFEKDFNYTQYRELAKSEKVVAIGEIGLDYYWKPKTTKKKEIFKQKQKNLLLKQLELAKELNLPVIFHCRMAHDDLIQVLKFQITSTKSQTNSKFQIQNSKLRGVMHGFVGTTEQLENYLELGLYIGFNGIIFKNIEGIDFEENIKETPLDRILIETDCPYLTPPQKTGRNEPVFVKYIAEEIAKIKNLDYEEITNATTANARKLFGL